MCIQDHIADLFFSILSAAVLFLLVFFGGSPGVFSPMRARLFVPPPFAA